MGAVFVPFSPQIVAHALRDFTFAADGNWEYRDNVYENLGYMLTENGAYRLPAPPRLWATNR